jgi:hypothetical protein
VTLVTVIVGQTARAFDLCMDEDDLDQVSGGSKPVASEP